MSLPISRRLGFSEIPIIDLEALRKGDNGGSAESTVNALKQACTDVGFFYVQNHGISAHLIDELRVEAQAFFQLPTETKNQIAINRQIRGYLPLYYRSYEGEERAGTSHQEGLWIGYDTKLDDKRPLDGPNQWPDNPTTLRTAMRAYFKAANELSEVLLQGFAMALGHSPNYFSGMFKRPTSRLKLNHYPPQHNPIEENNIGVVPHTDSGAFTILWQDDRGGLEIENKDGDWVGAPPIPDTFVVNIGNIMQYWSNGLFSSTPHRVINRGGADRYSIPLFVNPDVETTIQPLIGGDATFESFNYGEYQVELWRRTFPVANV